jgi:hypothetical protein
MKKSDKKIENSLRLALTKVCEFALNEVEGFQWLTHLVNYNDFPDSLLVVCIFETNERLAQAKSKHDDDYLINRITNELAAAGFKIRNNNSLVKFDTEENCKIENNGRWDQRLS